MATVEVELRTLGAMQFRYLARSLREIGPEGRQLRQELRKRITDAGRPVVQDVRQAVRDVPVKGTQGGGALQRRRAAVLKARTVRSAARAAAGRHSLRRAIASATGLRVVNRGVYIIVRASQMPEGQETLPKHLNNPKGWRHPVYGDRATWVHQEGHPYFDVTIRRHEVEFRRACEQAIEDVLNRVRQLR
jgi:hypothetical protein